MFRGLKGLLKSDAGLASYYTLSKTCQIPCLASLYEQYFGRRARGMFIEVGAYDGEYASNTSGLADLGWGGIYVEPVPAYAKRCRERHKKNPNVTCLNVAVGDREGVTTLHLAGPLSTSNERVKQAFLRLKWGAKSFAKAETHVAKVMTLDAILLREKIEPNFDLLVIDVEGAEFEVCQGFTINRWRPRMVIIELHDQNDNYWDIREECDSVVAYFEAARYRVVWKDLTNTVYVANEARTTPPSRR